MSIDAGVLSVPNAGQERKSQSRISPERQELAKQSRLICPLYLHCRSHGYEHSQDTFSHDFSRCIGDNLTNHLTTPFLSLLPLVPGYFPFSPQKEPVKKAFSLHFDTHGRNPGTERAVHYSTHLALSELHSRLYQLPICVNQYSKQNFISQNW